MEIYKKLLKVQGTVGAISKDSKNPFFKSNYFDINKLIAEVKPILQENGLILLQPIEGDKVCSVIVDPDTGEEVKSYIYFIPKDDPQKDGSAITYYRRYTLQSLLGLQAEDDDANLASNKTAKQYDNKAWLNIGTEEYNKVVDALKKGFTLDQVKSKYRISKKVEEELTKI